MMRHRRTPREPDNAEGPDAEGDESRASGAAEREPPRGEPPAELPSPPPPTIIGTLVDEAPDETELRGHTAEMDGHPEYYSQIKLVTEASHRIDFVRWRGPPPPPEYRAFRKQIEDVARVVRILFEGDEARLRDFFRQLHVTADSGLRGRHCSLEIGADNLQDVKDSIADAFPVIREKIWWSNLFILLGVTVICGAVSAIFYLVTDAWVPDIGDDKSIWPAIQLAAFLIPLGAAIGLFVEFVFRVGDDVPYEQLRAINPGRWRPFQRAFNTLVVAYVFAGILGLGAFQVGVASVLLNEFIDKKPVLSLAIGFVTGFAFPYVRDLVQQFRPIRRDAT